MHKLLPLFVTKCVTSQLLKHTFVVLYKNQNNNSIDKIIFNDWWCISITLNPIYGKTIETLQKYYYLLIILKMIYF